MTLDHLKIKKIFVLSVLVLLLVPPTVPSAFAQQLGVPNGTNNTDSWFFSGAGVTSHHDAIDESSPDGNTSFVETGTQGDNLQVSLSAVTDPVSSAGHILRVTALSIGGMGAERIQICLFEGATQIACSPDNNSFNLVRNTYTTLRTSPLAVSIMPGATSVKKDIVMPVESVEQDTVIVAQEEIADINTVGQWYPIAERQPLPWWLFQLLFLMPCMYIGYPFVSDKFIMLSGNSTRLARRRAFKQARKQVELAAKAADDKNLYAIFMQLFQQLGKLPSLPPKALHVLRSFSEGGAKDGNQEWNDFFERITHAAYAQSDNKNSDELCRMAKQWIERLEKII